MSESCIATPYINDEPSAFYQEMRDKTKDRELTNYIYARYLTSEVAKAMDDEGYKRNKQDQHSYKDVYKFLNIRELQIEQNKSVTTDGVELGTRTSEGEFIDFTNSEEAYEKAIQYNSKHSGRVAYVVQHGSVYNVIIENINVSNQVKKGEIAAQMQAWETFKTELTNDGIDVNELIKISEGSLNPIKLDSFLQTLKLYSSTTVGTDLLNVRDIKVYLTLNKHLPKVQALLNRGWGTIDEIAEKAYNILNSNEGTASLKSLVSNALVEGKSSFKFDIKSLQDKIKAAYTNVVENNDDFKLHNTIVKLNEEFDVYSRDINRTSKKIDSLEEAAAEAIISLERQIRRLEEKQGLTEGVKELTKLKDELSLELRYKQHYHGLTSFLQKAADHTTQIRQILNEAEIKPYTTTLEHVRNVANSLSKAENLKNAYYSIVDSLTRVNKLSINENLNKEDVQALEKAANDLKKIFDDLWSDEGIIARLQTDCTTLLLQEFIGSDPANGLDIAKLTEIMKNDGSVFDMLYSMGKSSNEVIALAGTIIRDQQTARDADLTTLSQKIRKITKELYDSGSNSEFMYDSKGRIITEEGVDWEAYAKAKAIFATKLKNQGITGLTAREAIETWERENTFEKVVDKKTGRTERLPNESYRLEVDKNPYNKLTDAQKKYYHEMMDIKGELASLLPNYAQKQYYAPQLRKGWLDVIRDGIKGKLSATTVTKLLWDKTKHFFGKVSADEADYSYNVTKSDYDNTPLQDIPVFYMHPVEFGNDDLLKDFSSALQSFASTALNYHAMNEIQSIVEMIRDTAGRLGVTSKKEGSNAENVDIMSVGSEEKGAWGQTKKIVVGLFAKKAKETKTYEMLNSYIDYHLYNIKMTGNKKINKLVNNLIGTNSLLKLSANVTGATMNIVQGDLQMLIESVGAQYYNPIDLMKAHLRLFGKGAKSPGIVWDLIMGTKGNFDVLLGEYFDVFNEEYQEKSNERYYKSPVRRLFGELNPMMMYSSGEGMIRSINMYAMLYHEKVKIDGKTTSLINAFTKTDRENGFSELKLIDNVTDLKGNPITLDSQYLKDFKKKIKGVAEDCFGSMNSEDKGLITQHFMGRAAMNFRQWMVGHYSRRFRGRHWDYQKNKYVEGYYRQIIRLTKDFIIHHDKYKLEYEMYSDEMKEEVKASWRKAGTEMGLLLVLMFGNIFAGDIDDEDDAFDRWLILLMKRSLQETEASTPIGMFTEGFRIFDNPIPGISTLQGLLYPFTGLKGDLVKWNSKKEKFEIVEIERGRHKGWSKYGRNVLWKVFPPYKQIDQLMHIDEEDNLFTPYQN